MHKLPPYEILKKEIDEHGIKHDRSMTLENSNGDISASTLGYQYTIQTTTLIRARVIEQKFYEVPIADYIPVVVGEGAWMETIQTNLVYDSAGSFESGIVSLSDPSNIIQVSTGLAPVPAVVATWNAGYQYSIAEVQKALASNNWDAIAAKKRTLKKMWDLGIQKLAFLGLKSNGTDFPGLLSNASVNTTTGIITKKISGMSTTEFQTLVSVLVADYYTNSNETCYPDKFTMPSDDYNGMAVAASPDFPIGPSKMKYLLDAFKEITGNPNFQILPLLYGQAANNAGYWAVGGTNRYVLYKGDEETVRMDIPVNFLLTAPGTSNNWNWNGVAAGQFTGANMYRPAQVRYYDWT